jgi:hypothetical protein
MQEGDGQFTTIAQQYAYPAAAQNNVSNVVLDKYISIWDMPSRAPGRNPTLPASHACVFA